MKLKPVSKLKLKKKPKKHVKKHIIDEKCKNCHFLMGYNLITRRNEELKSAFRKELIKGNAESISNIYGDIGCYFGVWIDILDSLLVDYPKILGRQDRKDFCFFWPYHPGMEFSAAKILQKREAENKAAAHDRRLTIVGLFIAVGALIVNTIIGILTYLKMK